jgi:hypothetical protein
VIDIVAGGYLVRTASVFDYNGDYTLTFAWAYLTGGTAGRGIVTIGHDDLSDYDIVETSGGTNKMLGGARAASGSASATSESTTAIATDDTIYYCALRRTGTTLDVFLGASPTSVTLEATGTCSDAGRATNEQILFNGYQVGGTHSGIGFLGRVRVYESALTEAEIETELASNSAVKASPWADWPMLDAATAGDDISGNNRDLTTSGIINDGPDLPDISAAIGGTATASINEADIVAGGKTITVTLTGTTWIAS